MATKRVRLLVGLAILLSHASFATPVGAPLEPTGKWFLDYGESQCVALRDYGDATNPTTLAIRPAPNGETYELLVGRKRYGPEFAEEFEGRVDFGSGPIKSWILHYGGKKQRLTLDQFRITSREMAQARTSSSVELRIRGGPNVTFSLHNMTALLKGLEDCTADLKRYWNEDGEKDGRIALVAKGDVRGVFTARDYPDEAMKRRQEGRAQFLLLVDELGKVAACHVLIPSGIPALDAMGCSVIHDRAKFSPAQNAQGKAVRSIVVTPPVIWRIGY